MHVREFRVADLNVPLITDVTDDISLQWHIARNWDWGCLGDCGTHVPKTSLIHPLVARKRLFSGFVDCMSFTAERVK